MVIREMNSYWRNGIFTSDHGFHLAEHRFWVNVSLHEESARIPLIIKIPGKPGVCHSSAELLDLYPTVADLQGGNFRNTCKKGPAKTIKDPDQKVTDMAFSYLPEMSPYLV